MSNRRKSASPTTSASRAATADEEAGISEGQSLEKVRDILIGGHLEAFDRRLVRLEKQLRSDIDSVRKDSLAKLEKLDLSLQRELAALGTELKSEREERKAAAKDGQREAREGQRGLEKQLSALDGENLRRASALQKALDATSKSLAADLEKKTAGLTAAFQKSLADLRGEKTDTAMLATLLNEMAHRLTEDFQLPGGE